MLPAAIVLVALKIPIVIAAVEAIICAAKGIVAATLIELTLPLPIRSAKVIIVAAKILSSVEV